MHSGDRLLGGCLYGRRSVPLRTFPLRNIMSERIWVRIWMILADVVAYGIPNGETGLLFCRDRKQVGHDDMALIDRIQSSRTPRNSTQSYWKV